MALLHLFLALFLPAFLKEATARGDIKIITRALNPNLLTAIDALAPRSSSQPELEYEHIPFQIPVPRMLSHPKSSSKSKLNSPESYHCRKNDTIVQKACFEFCTKLKHYTEGACSPDQTSCVCSTQGREPIKMKLFSPEASLSPKQNRVPFPLKSPKLDVTEIGKFDCDNSPTARSICGVFCRTRGFFQSTCSEDQTTCLCLAFRYAKSSRRQRDLIDAVEEATIITPGPVLPQTAIVGDKVVVDHPRPRRPLLTRQLPFLQGCTPFSCLNNCPRHCDSLCSADLQCFCSCPEDSFGYDYMDPPGMPFPFMQNPFWNY